MSPLDVELDRLAAVNNIPRPELTDGVFAMRARLWRELRRTATDAELIDALRLGVAADLARREGDDAQDDVPARAALADVGADAVALPRRGLRRAVGRLMGAGPR